MGEGGKLCGWVGLWGVGFGVVMMGGDGGGMSGGAAASSNQWPQPLGQEGGREGLWVCIALGTDTAHAFVPAGRASNNSAQSFCSSTPGEALLLSDVFVVPCALRFLFLGGLSTWRGRNVHADAGRRQRSALVLF